MGEMADYYGYYDLSPDDDNGPESEAWVTSEGERLLPSEMTTLHIENAIKYLKRTNPGSDWIDTFEEELEWRKRVLLKASKDMDD